MSFLVRQPGLLSTIQDVGRFGTEALGVPTSGAMDARSLSIANLLLGNESVAAALEMTLVGPTLEVTEATMVALAGADLGGTSADGRRLIPGRSYRLEAGTTVSFAGRSGTATRAGSRAYLAVPGGLDVPVVLGSRSTCLPGAFGGLDGRPLRIGDRLEARDPTRGRAPLVWPGGDTPSGPSMDESRPVRVLPGLIGDRGRLRGGLARLVGSEWTVDSDSDRMGVRLIGPAIAMDGTGELLSHGVPWGAIQLPPSGLPIILAADHQSTGGYPVIAVVATVDRDVVGQLAPGDPVRFELVDLHAARQALLNADARYLRLAAQLEEARSAAEGIDWAGA
jgi:antagonist of KipI